MSAMIPTIKTITPVTIEFNELRLTWSSPPTNGMKPNIPSIFTSLGPKFEIKRVYSPVVLGLNVVKKSFENSFVLTILPFGSRIDSLRVTFIDSSPECNITDTGRVVSLPAMLRLRIQRL